MAIRNVEIPDRVRRMWWRFVEMDQARWRHPDELVKDRISGARENLSLRLAQEVRSAAGIDDMDANARRR